MEGRRVTIQFRVSDASTGRPLSSQQKPASGLHCYQMPVRIPTSVGMTGELLRQSGKRSLTSLTVVRHIPAGD